MNAATLRLLAEKGLSIEDIIEVAESLERKSDPTSAERKRRQRERERDMSHRDVTRDIPEKEIPPHPPKKNTPPVSPKGDTAPQGAKRGSKISEDWIPPTVSELGPEFRKLAERWPGESYATEAAAFRSYWLAETGAKASKSSWKRAWENRIAQIHSKVMRDVQWNGATGPPGQADPLVARILARQPMNHESEVR